MVDSFQRPDSPYHGDGWETLNPGYWRIQGGTLRRRLENVGGRNPTTSFPWHWESRHRKVVLPAHRDISLPMGMIRRRDWRLEGNYTIRADLEVLALPPGPKAPNEAKWKWSDPAYSLMGICFGGECLFESRRGGGREGDASWMACWKDGRDVTADLRKGFLGRKTYVGRLPGLAPPYKVCGLGGHAIHGGGPDLPRAGWFQENWIHDQDGRGGEIQVEGHSRGAAGSHPRPHGLRRQRGPEPPGPDPPPPLRGPAWLFLSSLLDFPLPYGKKTAPRGGSTHP